MKAFFLHPVTATVFKVLISVLLLGGLIYYIDIQSVLHSFNNANMYLLLIGFLLAIIQLGLQIYRWKYLLRLVSKDISNEEVIISFFVGYMAGFFTPVQLGEFAGRIASHPNVHKSQIIGLTLIDKLYFSALTFIIGGSGFAIFIAEYFTEYWSPIYLYAMVTILLLLTFVFLFPEKILKILQFLPHKIRIHRFYEMIKVIENEFHNNNARIVFILTTFTYSIIIFEFYILALAFGDVSLPVMLMCGSAILFVKAVIFPVSFGDLGVRESAAVFFFEKVGASAAIAFNASIIMSFTNVIVPTAIGALLVTRLKRT